MQGFFITKGVVCDVFEISLSQLRIIFGLWGFVLEMQSRKGMIRSYCLDTGTNCRKTGKRGVMP